MYSSSDCWLINYVTKYLFQRMIHQLHQELFTLWCYAIIDLAESPFYWNFHSGQGPSVTKVALIHDHWSMQLSNLHNNSTKTLSQREASPDVHVFTQHSIRHDCKDILFLAFCTVLLYQIFSLCHMSQSSNSRVGSGCLRKILIRERFFNLNIRLFRDVQSAKFTTWRFLCRLQTEFWLILIIDLTPPLTKLLDRVPFEDLRLALKNTVSVNLQFLRGSFKLFCGFC